MEDESCDCIREVSLWACCMTFRARVALIVRSRTLTYDLWEDVPQDGGAETTQELLEAQFFEDGQGSAAPYPAGSYGTRRADAPTPRTALWIGVAIALALLAIYAFGVHFFSGHFFPQTSVSGMAAGGSTPADLARRIDAECASWTTSVTSGDFKLDLAAGDISLDVDDEAYANEAFAQQPSAFAWPAEVFKAHSYEVSPQRSYSSEQLAERVRQAVESFNEGATDATPPQAAYDKDKHEFVVTEGEYGTKIVPERAIEQVEAGVSEMSESIELTQDAHVAPPDAADPDLLHNLAATANQLIGLEIPVTLDGEERTRIGRDEIGSWIRIDETWGVYVSEDAVQEWIVNTLVPLLDYNDKQYAWHVYQDRTRPIIMSRIGQASSEPVEAVMWSELRVPDETPGASEKGRHIDINLDTQYARMYDESGKVIWESFIVSGLTDGKHETPTGEYAINEYMTRDIVLVGLDEDHDEKPDYETPVKYWMPFINFNVGLHDADWRYKFGGDIYKYDGSHGCVNLPPEKAEELYGIVHVGDKVIVHY